MKYSRSALTASCVVIVLSLAGCQDEEAASTSASEAAPLPVPTTAKLSAPITLDYSITGNPVVGQPVAVNVEVTSSLTDRTITLHYRMNEVGSMTFPESQATSTALVPRADAELRSQQLTLVPQREGRLFMVVSAEVETDTGTMMKSMSIPIQVGRAGAASAAGELVEGTDGEPGLSLPADDPR